MLEELINKFIFNSKKYIGGLFGFAFGCILITSGLMSMIIVMIMTLLGFVFGDVNNLKKLKKILLNKLK